MSLHEEIIAALSKGQVLKPLPPNFGGQWGCFPLQQGKALVACNERDVAALAIDGLIERVPDVGYILANEPGKTLGGLAARATSSNRTDGARSMLNSTKSLILGALAPQPGQPPRALRQYGWPHTGKWGVVPSPGVPLKTFEDRDIRQLYVGGMLSFVSDKEGTAAALADAGVSRPEYAFASELAARDQQIRRLRVGDGPTFEELCANGKAGGGVPYSFEDLLQVDGKTPTPSLVFIHIPRTAGTTINNILMRNYKYRADSYGANFFPPYFPSQFLSLVAPPQSTDDRVRHAFFTGHIDLGNEIFHYMPGRYVILTALRDPVDRVVSHYRFNSTQPSVFQTAIRDEKLSVVDYLRKFGPAIPQQYELFSPASTLSGADRVGEALRNLEMSVALFGLQENFDQLPTILAATLGLPNVSSKRLNKLPPGAARVTSEQREELGLLLKHDIDFYDRAAQVYRRRLQVLNDRQAPDQHPWSRFYA